MTEKQHEDLEVLEILEAVDVGNVPKELEGCTKKRNARLMAIKIFRL